jgi:oligosaccharide repeat unit polymerase
VEFFPTGHSYLTWYSFKATALAPIPRAWFGGKPDSIATPFTNAFAPSFRTGGSSVPPSLLGEGYISFGAAGVVLYASGYGLFTGYVYRHRFRSPRMLYLAAVSAGSMLQILRGEMLASTVFFLVVGGSGALVFKGVRFAAVDMGAEAERVSSHDRTRTRTPATLASGNQP